MITTKTWSYRHILLLTRRVIENKPKYILPDITYAKEELGANLPGSKILGVALDKKKDIFGVNLKTQNKKR